MKKVNKWWWVAAGLAVLLVIILIISSGNQAEYAEIGDSAHLKGSPEASVSLVEFSDFQCPACGKAFKAVQDITQEFGDKIKFEYKHFPLTSIHRYAYQAATASECAADQGKFWEYHDLLFLNQASLSKSDLFGHASQVEGLDAELFGDCLNSGVKEKYVDQDLALAQRQGYNSTPTFILNGQKVDDWGQLANLIRALLEPLTPQPQQ